MSSRAESRDDDKLVLGILMKKKSIIISIAIFALCALGFTAYESIYLKINQNIDIFGRVYKEIVGNYVDEVDPEKFMRSGIEGRTL